MVDAKQFIISDKAYHLDLGWKGVRLQSGKWLSWEPSLHVVINKTCNAVLLGDAWSVCSRATPEETVASWTGEKKTFDEIINIEKNWCGRYVLIVDDCIYLDAVGLLQVFYSEKCVSSSLNVIVKAEGREIKKPKLIYGLSPDFVPGKNTCYEDIKRLLPSEILNYVTNEISMRKLLPDGVPELKDGHLEQFIEMFANSLRNMKCHFYESDVWLALTGGRDSRVTMALLEYADIPYQAFTLEHDNISEGDINIPKILAKIVGKEHLYIRKKKSQRKLEEEYNRHTFYMTVDQGRNFFARNQYKELLAYSDKVVILRSGIWECAVEYYFRGEINSELTLDDLKRIFPIINFNQDFKEGLTQWNSSIGTDVKNKELTDDERLYWEIRAACWLATGELAFDMMENISSVQPANSRVLISMMLSFDKSERIKKIHEDKIIQHACGSISNVEYDTEYKYNKLKKLKKLPMKVRQLRLLFQYYGLHNTIKFYLK